MTAPHLSAEARLIRLSDALDVPDGGFSIDPRTGGDVRVGYAVATHPERERRIGGKVSPSDIQAFVYDNADLLTQEGKIIGGWRDPQSGDAFLDISEQVHDRETALILGGLHNQLAVWDFARGVSISV
jgi:hypothetical protein